MPPVKKKSIPNEEKSDEEKGFLWFITVLWANLDGVKTIIGAVLTGISVYMEGCVQIFQYFEYQVSTDIQLTIALIAYTGTFIAGGGMAHKYQKAKRNKAS